jgi:WD40 repeat protein
VAFSPDGKTLAVGNRNAETHLFEVATGKVLHTLGRTMSHELRFHPQGKILAIAYVDGNVALWETATGKLLHLRKTSATEIYTLDWSPAGDILATAGLNSKITLWNGKDLSLLKDLPSPEWVISLRFTRDGTRLLSAGGTAMRSADRHVQVWGIR